jgi:hypothetical protein
MAAPPGARWGATGRSLSNAREAPGGLRLAAAEGTADTRACADRQPDGADLTIATRCPGHDDQRRRGHSL